MAADPTTRKPSNFEKGIVHSITTIDTPHMPAFLAQVLVGMRQAVCGASNGAACRYYVAMMDAALARLGQQGSIADYNALDDLATVNLPAYDGAAFALAGDFPLPEIVHISAALALPPPLDLVYAMLHFVGLLPSIPPSDGVVSVESQLGLLQGPVTPWTLHLSTFGGLGPLDRAANRSTIVDLLTGATPFQNGFPATPGSARTSRALAAGAGVLETAAPLVVITEPADGATVHPGETLTVVVAAAPGAAPAEVLIGSAGDPMVRWSASVPFTAEITVPADANGRFPIVATAKDASGALAPPVTRVLQINSAAALTAIEVAPSTVHLGAVGRERVLWVQGHYADGVTRFVTAPETGTTYVSSDPTVVTVGSDGRLRAAGFGQAVVTVANGSQSVDVPVTVAPDPDEPCGNGVVDAGEQCDPGIGGSGCCSATCQLEPAGRTCRPAVDTCDAIESCDGASAACPADATSPDTDQDGRCDAIDPCTNGAQATAKLTMTKLASATGTPTLKLTGRATLASPAVLDPRTTGVRVVITDAFGATIVDAPVPGGSYDPTTKTGWKVNGNATKWTYGNPAGSSGITKVVFRDQSAKTPGGVAFAIAGKHSGWHVDDAPGVATLVLDAASGANGRCADAPFPGPPPAPSCTFNATRTMVKCR